MAETVKDAWNEVGDRFSTWGRQVAERYRSSGGAENEGAREAQRKLEEAARDLAEQLNKAFTALGDTLRDEGGKQGLKEAVRSLGEAVSVTATEAAGQIRKRVAS